MLETYTVLTLSHLVIPFSLFQSFTWHWLLNQGLRNQQGAKSSRKRYRNRSGLEGNEKLTRTMVRERAQNWAQEWNVWEIENEKELGFSIIKCSNETICLIFFFSFVLWWTESKKKMWLHTDWNNISLHFPLVLIPTELKRSEMLKMKANMWGSSLLPASSLCPS